MADPLPLTHPRLPGLTRSDFVVAPSNAVALAMIDQWRDWPGGKLVLTGPPGSGKTHLAHIWAAEANARILAARDLERAAVPELASTALVVEDADAIPDAAPQDALFHLHNLMREAQRPLLLTGSRAVASWPLTLPDLKSRLQGAQSAVLDRPDDTLLNAVLVKLFIERQLQVSPQVVHYLLRRMDRSFDAARRVVEALDFASLAQRRAITTRLAAEVLDKIEGAES
ncbi:hypothetical protein OB2597_15345 [Pseudooceanicola batsensis HTCC2597]|uniref:Uncharacterized protein n=1 Tax=Pseudooceanicola batsensis (strain ATCC BAA-863 / DSM 15984 / KCTC 12145 / HTCC2597) TaxID=252305 RepID=A3TYV1_PSEBH|nr:AAA family ATPase [Pseudooceanicola batsensis]EAQ02769.1 hypothetical protein OB2597_15345 [Pseudooceanicola batsensis HTCC2597]